MKPYKYLMLGVLALAGGCYDDMSSNDVNNPTSPRATTYVSITGTIQAESYAQMSGVQLENTSDTGGGQNVGWIDANDWMIYNVTVPTSGSYKIYYRVASLNGGGNLQLERGGGGLTYGTLAVPKTGGWQTWTTISHTVTLSAGNQQLAIKANSGGWNINWWGLATTSTTGTGGGTMQSTFFTSYGYNDNDDGNGHYGTATIAYPNSQHSIATEGTGTYNDPITFATDPREIAPQTIIYVPFLQKYFRMEDGCAECTTDWDNGRKWRTDLFMGGNTFMQTEPNLSNCESYITRNDIMYINAGPGYPVDTTPLFNSSTQTCTARLH